MPLLPPFSANQLQTVFEQSPFGIAVFGPDGNCLGGNAAWSRIWGAPREQLAGYNILNDPQLETVDPTNVIRRAFEGETNELPVTHYDPTKTGRHGRPRYIQGVVFPIKNAAQEVCQVVGTYIDVTAQEILKREFSASRDFLAEIGRVAPTLIAVYDVGTGEYLHLSEAFEKILGYPAEKSRQAGLPFILSLIHPEDLPKLMVQQEAALAAIAAQKPGERSNPIIPFEYRMRASDGSWKWIRTLGSVFGRDESGRVKTIINASLDITETKEAVRFRDEFLAIASHELKTPLTPLKLQIGLLNSALERGDLSAIPTPVLRKLTQTAGQQIDRLTGLVNSLLDVSRITMGRLELKREEGDLGGFVRQVVEGFSSQAAEANCAFRIDAPTGIPVMFDSLRMSQVIGNLVSNAIVHSATRLIEVRVESRPEMNRVQISVRDEGKGIAPADLERIFERFERGAVAPSVTGFGLGLFIARQIARAHGGEIRVDSCAGKGTTFVVELPCELSP